MASTRSKFRQESKDELCREVVDSSKRFKSVVIEYGVGTETLSKWLKKYKEAHGGAETEP